MKYDKFTYLYPTRPEQAIVKEMLPHYEAKGWIAQIKKNGQCSIIAISPTKEMIFMNRHNEKHKRWTPTKEIKDLFSKLPDKWFYFCGEILHNKTPHIKNTIYIYDILVANGKYLTGESYDDRQALLYEIFIDLHRKSSIQMNLVEEGKGYYKVTENVWLVRNYVANFKKVFDSITNPEDEGLVLKDPKAKLGSCFRKMSNGNWQRKCRLPQKNYGY